MTVILANGDYPHPGGEAHRLLESALRIVACDGAGRKVKADPSIRAEIVVVGDGDSGDVDVLVSEQETNDLEKAYRYCLAQGWRVGAILGATGGREDHALGNIFRALEWGVDVVTGRGRFYALAPGNSPLAIQTGKGAAVSVFAPDPATRISSEGLEWPLNGVKFPNLYCATLNRAASGSITLSSDRKVFVYVAQT